MTPARRRLPRRQALLKITLMCAALSSSTSTLPQETTSASPAGVEFELTRPSAPSRASAEILDGHPAIPLNWPATFAFTGSAAGQCTATAIGPRVLLTAAHCIEKRSTGRMKDSSLTFWCTPHPWYEPKGDTSYDVALCVSSASIPTLKDRPYETIDVSTRPRVGDSRLTMLGYGCTARGGSKGNLYEGTSPITRANGQLVLFYTEGGAAVCAGDSGGGAYRLGAGDARRLVGVASAALPGTQSQFVAIADDGVVTAFLEKWAKETKTIPSSSETINIKICGLDDKETKNLFYCRS